MSLSFFWFRRDLRLEDNAGLYHALRSGQPVLPLFIFDREILDELPKNDQRVRFIHGEISRLKKELRALGTDLLVHYGKPLDVWKKLSETYAIQQVFTNHDYEPYATERDAEIGEFLGEKNIGFQTFKDQVIFEKEEVMKPAGGPYTVFTPYSKRWKAALKPYHLKAYPTEKYFSNFHKAAEAQALITLPEMGFSEEIIHKIPDRSIPLNILKKYSETRDFPAQRGTSRLSVHLRFGTISIRALGRAAQKTNETYLNELIWRDFYHMILWHFPRVVALAFRPAYDTIPWKNDAQHFEAWKNGETGYPLVDAGMRELNATGFMHNRVRMVVASFLTKHLLIDWRWGEAYFAEKLLDFDLAANNGGWQWAAGSGCDAAPYFRVFNPESQLKKFDPKLAYTKKWVSEYGEFGYAKPIVEHKFARNRALETYKTALEAAKARK